MTESVELIEFRTSLHLAIPDADVARTIGQRIEDLTVPDGLTVYQSAQEDAETESLDYLEFIASDGSQEPPETPEITHHAPNTITAQYEDGTLVIGLAATMGMIEELAAWVSEVGEEVDAGFVIDQPRYQYEVRPAFDPAPNDVIDHLGIPPDSTIDIESEPAEDRTIVTLTISEAAPPKQHVHLVIPGLVGKFGEALETLPET